MRTITQPAAMPVVHRAVAPLLEAVLRDQSATGDGSLTFTGVAAVTGQTTTLYSGKRWEWREQIAPGAFRDVLELIRSGGVDYPVVLNHEHDNRAVMASTGVAPSLPYGMELAEGPDGLRVFARLDPVDPDVMRVAPKLRAGAVSQMSFAFVPGDLTTLVEEDEAGRTIETDTITTVKALYDVTVCAHGAYPSTSTDLRGLLAASGRSGFDPEGHQRPESRADVVGAGGAAGIAPVSPVGDGDLDRARLAAARRRLRAAVATHDPKGRLS